MEFIRGQAIVGFPFGLVNKSTGDSITIGTPVVYITLDGGTQFAGSNVPVHEGNGQWTVNFNGNETDATFIGIMITHTDAIPQHFAIKTSEPTVPVAIVTVTSSGTSISDTFQYYGTLVAADLYFANRLNGDCWEQAIVKDRQTALIAATRLVEKLNYAGDKHLTSQMLQFPRGTDVVIPVEIEYAAYEIAIKLLEGVNQEIEIQTLGVMTESYSGIRTAYDPEFVNEHIRAGIPSSDAWALLKPFLRDQRQVTLQRVS